jgi:death-on-curing protein
MHLLPKEYMDLTASDDESLGRVVKFLCAGAQYSQQWLLARYGGHPGSDRGLELLEQVIAAPFQTWGGQELHPDPFEKAAMLWRGITQGHPFGDGNKRCGLAMAAYYLDVMGFPVETERWDTDAVYEFCIRVSAGEIRDIQTMVEKLWEWWGVEQSGDLSL